MIIKNLCRQQRNLLSKHPYGVSIIINEEDVLDIQAEIDGPIETPYEGGLFRVKFQLASEFPNVPPKGYFMTKIFHPNVSEKGEICVNTLKKDWDPRCWSLYNILEVINYLNEIGNKMFVNNSISRKFIE
jgi:ubiquitin-conjugating enzyme E2 S